MGEREIEQRLEALEAKVDDLYRRLDGSAPATSGFASDSVTFASDAPDPEIVELLQQDKMIQAIKRYRELTGTSLAEAKDVVEDLARQYRPLRPPG